MNNEQHIRRILDIAVNEPDWFRAVYGEESLDDRLDAMVACELAGRRMTGYEPILRALDMLHARHTLDNLVGEPMLRDLLTALAYAEDAGAMMDDPKLTRFLAQEGNPLARVLMRVFALERDKDAWLYLRKESDDVARRLYGEK